VRRAGPVLLLGALGVMLLAPSASAHALLVSSDPKQGTQLDAAPDVVTITFSEEAELAFSSIRVLDAEGVSADDGSTEVVSGDALSLRVGLGDLEQGVYTVAWRVISRVDGHATGGAFAFGIGVDPAGAVLADVPIEETPPPSPFEIGARWALYVGLGLLLGVAWVGAAAFRELHGGVWRVALLAWLVAVIGVIVLAEVQRRATGASIGALLGTSIGQALIWRAVAIGFAGVALRAARSLAAPGRDIALWLAGAAAAGAMFVHVSAGHAGTGDQALRMVIGQWVHFAAAGVWLGGLGALLAGIKGQDPGARGRAVRRFSTVAGVTLFVVAGTGVVRAFDELPSFSALWSSWYGRVVVIKVVLIVALGTLGAINRYRNVPQVEADASGLRRVSRAELLVAALVLVAAGSLATLSPPTGAAAEAASRGPITLTETDFAGATEVTLLIDPGFAGPNTFTARVTETLSDRPLEGAQVRLIFGFLDEQLGGAQLRLKESEPGVYSGSGAAMGLDGRWRITVLVQRAADSSEIAFETATRCRTNPIPVEGGPTLYDVTLADGRTAQGYVDPGEVGYNEVHITFFDEQGQELEVAEAPAMTAMPRDGEATELVVRRFGPGHFIGDAQLEADAYRFDVVATTGEQQIRTCFEESIV